MFLTHVMEHIKDDEALAIIGEAPTSSSDAAKKSSDTNVDSNKEKAKSLEEIKKTLDGSKVKEEIKEKIVSAIKEDSTDVLQKLFGSEEFVKNSQDIVDAKDLNQALYKTMGSTAIANDFAHFLMGEIEG